MLVMEEEELIDFNDDEMIEINFLKVFDEIKVLFNVLDAEVYLVDSVFCIDGYDMNIFDVVFCNVFMVGMVRFLGIVFVYVCIIDVIVVYISIGRRLLTDLFDVEFVVELLIEEFVNVVV